MANVDTSIYPSATGTAATTAAEHASDHPLKLYAGWFCPFVQRAWMVLQEKRIAYQYIEINPYHKAPEFLALNPRGLVPTLGVPADKSGQEQRPLYESSVICEYLDEEYAEEEAHGPTLLPKDAYARARCRIWMDHAASKIIPSFYRLLQHKEGKDYSLDEGRDELHKHIRTLVEEMAPAGPWFLGETFSLVDVMLAPWAVRLWLLDHFKAGGLGIPEAGTAGDDGVWQRWRTWTAAIAARPSVVETLSERTRYIGVYQRYADDTTNSMVGQATRRGMRLP